MAEGKKTGGGSRLGRPNKATAGIKAMILGALSDVGGQEYLKAQAVENPTAFLTLIGKILPKEVEASITGDIKYTIIERVIVDVKTKY